MFISGSLFGYVLEVLFRRFFSAKRWVNPGFNKGPWLPLYGFGLVTMFSLCLLLYSILPKDLALYNPNGNLFGRTLKVGPSVMDLVVVLSIWVGMILLEFFAGLIFVKGFKVRLWDYTNMKGNILGVICPLFNIFWLILVLAYYYLLSPLVYNWIIIASTYMFGSSDGSKAAHFLFILALGIVYGIFLIDNVTSLHLFPSIVRFAKEKGIIDQYEKMRDEVRKNKDLAKAKIAEKIPQKIKDTYQKQLEKKKNPSRFKLFMRKLLLINPDISDASNNYDENGRPISDK